MNATSAIPIISAAAVEAVLPGLRREFPLASRPATPPTLRAGNPTIEASGRTSREESIATPRKSRRTPPAIESSRSLVPSASENIALASRTSERRTMSAAIHGVNRAKRECGSVAPSRTAAMGGTRVARIAGNSPASSVMPMPTMSETTIVLVAKTRSALGRSTPSELKSASIPSARRRPRISPTMRREEPDDERLEDHGAEDLTPRRADRPQRRELARPLRDRDRERVEDDERADEEGDRGEREEEVAEDRRELADLVCLLLRLGTRAHDLGRAREDR